MTKIYFSALAAALLLWGCKDDQSVVGPPSEDLTLKANLVGTWTLGRWYKVSYNADGTFVDSAFVQSHTDTNQYSLLEVRQGRYTVENSILDHINVHYVYLDTTVSPGGMGAVTAAVEIQIAGNHIIRKPVDVLTSAQGVAYQLWGTWMVTKWAYERAAGPPRIIYEGRQRYTFTFYSDSNYFHWGFEYLDGNPWPNPSWRSQFTYNPPYLDAPGIGASNKRVEFKLGKMYWYYEYTIPDLLRTD
jgi:hypothetical protein